MTSGSAADGHLPDGLGGPDAPDGPGVPDGLVELAGGTMGPVHREGDTVLRGSGEWTPAVHRLLRHLSVAGIAGVPRPLGLTGDGRERLTYLPGEVPAYPMPAWVWEEPALVSAARLLRRIHDATVTADPRGPWRSAVHEPPEVVCHNDFATYNLVFRGGEAVGVIDWDFASPGPRLWDLAYLAYRIVPLTASDRADGHGDEERRARLGRLLTAYGTTATLGEVLDVVRERLLDLAAFSDRMAGELGRPELAEHAVTYRRDAAELPGW